MVTLEAIVGSTVYNLSDGSPWRFLNATGVGMPPVRNVRTRGYGQVGSSRTGFDIGSRTILITLAMQAATRALADTYRGELAEMLQPLANTPIQLRFTREDGTQRQIDCWTASAIDFPMTVQDRSIGLFQRVILQMEALNPIPYDPVIQVQEFFDANQGFAVAVDIPWVQTAATSVNNNTTILYPGKWRTSPTFVLSGSITDAKIVNDTTGETLDFTGVTIADGDTYTITTGYGNQSVLDTAGATQLADLTNDSDLGTFHLAANPEAVDGNNSMTVTGTGTNENTAVLMRWYNRYLTI